MNKLTLILIAALLFSGCQKNTVENKPSQTKPDVFTSIQDAITKQLVLKCEYADTDGQKTTTYIKGQTVRMVGTGKEETIQGLMKDNKFYLWDSVKKEGMELDLTKMTADGSVKMGDKPIKSTDDVVAVLQEKKDSCSLSPQSANLLELPTDVKFIKSEDFLK
jgi:hypothetical protein